MDFTLLFNHLERESVALLEALGFSLGQVFQLLVIGVRQMPKCEDVLGLVSTGVRGVVDPDYIGQLKGVALLRQSHTA